METELHACRICASSRLIQVVDLGHQIITSRFPVVGDTSTPSTRVRLVQCADCGLVQLKDTTSSSELYEHMYGYRSGLNATMRNHLQTYNAELQSYVPLQAGNVVLDIGSNDATFLKNYPSSVRRIGCDPTGTQFREFYGSDIELIPTYFTKANVTGALGDAVRFKLVSSISMFYDLPDPVQFAKDIYDLLDDDGVWTLEQSYALTMIERNSIDTICHEHLEYYGVKQIKEIMDRAGFKILHISLNECNGGSFRIFVGKRSSARFEEATELVTSFLEKEARIGLHTPAIYEHFMARCGQEAEKLRIFLETAKANGKRTYICGASTKGNCLLQFAKIGPELAPYAVERNPLKIGHMTSTGIEIISEETMRANPPEYMLMLPWHFRKEIVEREHAFLEGGGQFLFPFPSFEVYGLKPTALITGIDGQIGRATLNEYKSTHTVYGITHHLLTSASLDPSCLTFVADVTNIDRLRKIVTLLRPNAIVHLASISNTEDCERDPIKTVETNGMATVNLCDIIHKNQLNCHLFNASSSENYKGHQNYVIEENDTHLIPSTMYGVAKCLSQHIVDYYRTRYGLPFSNGILFTTESSDRKESFLLKKIAVHAKQWHTTRTVLKLGNLDSYRSINHAHDVASAIKLITSQTTGDNYVICSNQTAKVEDLVIQMYKLFDIHLVRSGPYYVDSITNHPVLEVGPSLRTSVTNITGHNTKLIALGWAPRYDMLATLKEIAGF